MIFNTVPKDKVAEAEELLREALAQQQQQQQQQQATSIAPAKEAPVPAKPASALMSVYETCQVAAKAGFERHGS